MPEPKAVYETIKMDPPQSLAELDGMVIGILFAHRGKANRIPRIELVNEVYGLELTRGSNLANSYADRKVRAAIERLRKKHTILSSSGNGGYYMPETFAEVEEYTREIVSRARKLEKQSRRLLTLAQRNFGHQMSLE